MENVWTLIISILCRLYTYTGTATVLLRGGRYIFCLYNIASKFCYQFLFEFAGLMGHLDIMKVNKLTSQYNLYINHQILHGFNNCENFHVKVY